MSPLVETERAEARLRPRSNMFLSAVLHGPGSSTPVRIRNMSESGALVEMPARPDSQGKLRLVRGQLEAAGRIIWSEGSRSGLCFAAPVSVDKWMAPVRNAEQQRIDDTVRLLKLGAVPLERSGAAPPAHRDIEDEIGRLSADLRCVARLVENLGGELASDARLLADHNAKLQNLDIAVQLIAAIASALSGSEIGGTAAARLENLRSSCASALAASR